MLTISSTRIQVNMEGASRGRAGRAEEEAEAGRGEVETRRGEAGGEEAEREEAEREGARKEEGRTEEGRKKMMSGRSMRSCPLPPTSTASTTHDGQNGNAR